MAEQTPDFRREDLVALIERSIWRHDDEPALILAVEILGAIEREHEVRPRVDADTRAEAERLRAERNALLWVVTVMELDIVDWTEHFVHTDECGGDCADGGGKEQECVALNSFRPALVRDTGSHGPEFLGWLPAPEALAEFASKMDRWGYTMAALLDPEEDPT